MFILKEEYQPGIYVPLRALFLVFQYFELSLTQPRFQNNQNAVFPRLTSWRYMIDVTQMSVNKQHYWLALTFLCPMAHLDNIVMRMWTWLKIDPFIKV